MLCRTSRPVPAGQSSRVGQSASQPASRTPATDEALGAERQHAAGPIIGHARVADRAAAAEGGAGLVGAGSNMTGLGQDASSSGSEPFYITTAISYVNGAPHVGHAYEIIVSDVIARWQQGSGRDVRFLTGTDEHGQKIAATAAAQGVAPLALCSRHAAQFRALNPLLGAAPWLRFGRTTDANHRACAQWLWRRVAARGDIYFGTYAGWYNVREETFVPDHEAAAANFQDPASGDPLQKMEEKSYFFRMSRYHERLLAHIEANPDFIRPDYRRNEIVARLRKDPLQDLSVSRSSFDWGIPVPDDEGHVMYVWFDALTNYLTGINMHLAAPAPGAAAPPTPAAQPSAVSPGPSSPFSHPAKKVDSSASAVSAVSENSPSFSPGGGDNSTAAPKSKSPADAASPCAGAGGGGDGAADLAPALRYWPANIHMIGKDILWFHSVIWPCMLMSADIPLPRTIFAHGFVVAGDGRKMSKSLGNVFDPVAALTEGLLDAEAGPGQAPAPLHEAKAGQAETGQAAKKAGKPGAPPASPPAPPPAPRLPLTSDTLRYFIVKSAELGRDLRLDVSSLKAMHNADLADGLGNLMHRATGLCGKMCSGRVPATAAAGRPFDAAGVVAAVSAAMERLELQAAVEATFAAVRDTNKFLTDSAPWTLKGEPERQAAVVRALLEALFVLAHLLQPVIPAAAARMFDRLGTARRPLPALSAQFDNLAPGTPVATGDVLFPKFA